MHVVEVVNLKLKTNVIGLRELLFILKNFLLFLKYVDLNEVPMVLLVVCISITAVD